MAVAALYEPVLAFETARLTWLPLLVLLMLRAYFAIWPHDDKSTKSDAAKPDVIGDLHLRIYRDEISGYRSNLRYQRYDEAEKQAHDRRHLDALLDKIAQHGLGSLSVREKRELERLSGSPPNPPKPPA